jgi:uncharacterized protein
LSSLVTRDTVKELLRVLAYPKFNLTTADQRRLVEDLLSCAEVISLPDRWPDLPLCRDKHDQVFLVLAHVGAADALVSGDADLLSMRNVVQLRILTAEELEMYVNNVIQDAERRNYEWRLTENDPAVSAVGARF